MHVNPTHRRTNHLSLSTIISYGYGSRCKLNCLKCFTKMPTKNSILMWPNRKSENPLFFWNGRKSENMNEKYINVTLDQQFCRSWSIRHQYKIEDLLLQLKLYSWALKYTYERISIRSTSSSLTIGMLMEKRKEVYW